MEQAQPQQAAADTSTELVSIDATFEPLIPKFLSNRKREVTAIREALTVGDFETVQRISHGMKGAGGSYGFDRISDMAASIEQAAKAGNSSTIEHDLPVLDAYLSRIKVVYD